MALDMWVKNLLDRIFSENENILWKIIRREYLESFLKNESLNIPEHFKALEKILTCTRRILHNILRPR
jgi:hypothetical protein